MEDYLWIVVLGAFASFSAAFGIGANDVANAFATSVGSKAITVRQACVMAVIGEFLGATFLGGEVVKTIRKGIADEGAFEDNPAILMWGCFSVLIATSAWLLLATRLEMPVSTTHSTIGGMIGMSMAAHGPSAVHWFKPMSSFPFAGGFVGVVISWFLSPIASAIVSALLFYTIRRVVLRSRNPFKRAIFVYPVFVFSCLSIITMFMLMKGIKVSGSVKTLAIEVKFAISVGVGAIVSLALIPFYRIATRRIEAGKFKLATPTVEDIESSKKEDGGVEDTKPATTMSTPSMPTTLNADVHAVIASDSHVQGIHQNAEKFDKKAETFFVYLQILSAFFDSVCHGSNDVANAIAPFATIYAIHNTGLISDKTDMNEERFWILGMGGAGICLGLLCYGYRILQAIGVKLAFITPSRGFSIEMGSSLVVIIGSYNKWPLSTTHCQVGSTVGVALMEGVYGINQRVLVKTLFGWVITCLIVGSLAAAIFSLGAYAPCL